MKEAQDHAEFDNAIASKFPGCIIIDMSYVIIQLVLECKICGELSSESRESRNRDSKLSCLVFIN